MRQGFCLAVAARRAARTRTIQRRPVFIGIFHPRSPYGIEAGKYPSKRQDQRQGQKRERARRSNRSNNRGAASTKNDDTGSESNSSATTSTDNDDPKPCSRLHIGRGVRYVVKKEDEEEDSVGTGVTTGMGATTGTAATIADRAKTGASSNEYRSHKEERGGFSVAQRDVAMQT